MNSFKIENAIKTHQVQTETQSHTMDPPPPHTLNTDMEARSDQENVYSKIKTNRRIE